MDDTLGWAYSRRASSPPPPECLLRAVAKDPKNAGYQYHLGLVYVATGETAKARASLEKALAIDPAFSGAVTRRVLAASKG